MGYAWAGICHQTTDAALAAFIRDVPRSADSINTFAATPTIDGTGVITWSILNRPLTGDLSAIRLGTTQLPSCVESVDQWPVQSILLIVALFFAAFVGFKTGYRP